MADLSFVQKSALFSYSGVNCIRNDYFHNDCQKCVDICPVGAFHIVRNAVTLFANECIECSACIGSCPTEALTIINFDPNAFTLAFDTMEKKTLSCKDNTNCLGVFDAHHYITMALKSKDAPVCDLSHCEGCKLNVDKKVESFIRQEIETANDFLIACGVGVTIEKIEIKPEEENPKRTMFKAAFSKAKDAAKEKPEIKALTIEHQRDINAPKVPLKFLHLKNAIKDNITKFTTTTHTTNFGLFAEKSISFSACTNCGECVQFCPTNALVATPDKQGINFNVGDCIACGICDHICKTDAITTKEGIDLIEFAYDRGKELVHYEMVMCHECRCPYPYRGGDPICDRCADYTKDFSHMFVLAKDL
ncbi:MAG: 4Fe-4S binding protein [Sulfurimonadaceae bacterium]|jgi:ferredoxin|nr:4Fe-4S binding protein [Sulfurimonadaceae bacterium]